MGLIPEKERVKLTEKFAKELTGTVTLAVFTQEFECPHCKDTRQLVEELSELSEKINVEVYDFAEDEKAKSLGVDKIPAIAVLGEKDYGIRFYGIPSGYEFSTLVEDIVNVSNGSTQLSEEVKKKLKEITQPVHIQVFVTLSCPYCPRMVRLAHQAAVENDHIRADMVESMEFPHLAHKYGVMSVPKTVINETVEFVGAVPEEHFLHYVLKASQPSGMVV